MDDALVMNRKNLDIDEFLNSGFNLKSHLADNLQLSIQEVDSHLRQGSKDLAALHPGALPPEKATDFYESEVGTSHLLELAAWHLTSSDYIADTLRLQEMFAKGLVLDFGGGIGTHTLFAAGLETVEHVWFVDLNPHNRFFVERRAKLLGLENKISIFRDLESIQESFFDTFICLDVLEHLPNPTKQLFDFLKRMKCDSRVLLNWYFFKGFQGEYPFHFDEPQLVESFFETLQTNFLEVFHPFLITTRVYKSHQKDNLKSFY